MITVEAIKHAVAQLAPAEFHRLASRFSERHHDLWKQQTDHDAKAGKLDFLFTESDSETRPKA